MSLFTEEVIKVAANGNCNEFISMISKLTLHNDTFDYNTVFPLLKVLFNAAQLRNINLMTDEDIYMPLDQVVFNILYHKSSLRFINIKALLDAGLDPNIIIDDYSDPEKEKEEVFKEPYPLLIAVIIFESYDLMDYILKMPNIEYIPEMRECIKKQIEPLEHCCKVMDEKINNLMMEIGISS